MCVCDIYGKRLLLVRQRQDQESLSRGYFCLCLRGAGSRGTGEHPDSPSLSNPPYWEGAESKREHNLRMGAADFRLPFSQPLLGVVWRDHQ